MDHGQNGFRVRSKAELLSYSLKLLQDDNLAQKLADNAQIKSQDFSRIKFEERVQVFFDELLRSYKSPPDFA